MGFEWNTPSSYLRRGRKKMYYSVRADAKDGGKTEMR